MPKISVLGSERAMLLGAEEAPKFSGSGTGSIGPTRARDWNGSKDSKERKSTADGKKRKPALAMPEGSTVASDRTVDLIGKASPRTKESDASGEAPGLEGARTNAVAPRCEESDDGTGVPRHAKNCGGKKLPGFKESATGGGRPNHAAPNGRDETPAQTGLLNGVGEPRFS